MAIAIKTVPILKASEAIRFDKSAKVSFSKKSSIKFSKEIAVSSKILAKAKI